MKKVLSLVIIFIIFLFIYFVQSNFFTWFNIFGVKPSMYIILAVFLGLFLNKKYSFTISVLFGLLLDLFIGINVGMNGIALGIASLLGNRCSSSFSKESRLTIMIIIMISTCVCEFITYTLKIIIGMDTAFLNLLPIIFIEIIYNTMLVIIIYPILQRVGRLLETVFEQDKFKQYF